ncbi:WD40-repeat-containing domain protein, partial [Phlyctochytrium arcticum]
TLPRHVGHKYSVTAVRWFPRDTGLFTTSSMDGELKVWDTNVFKSVTTFAIGSHVYVHEHSPISLNHSLIATGTMEAPVRLCDLRSGAYVQVLSGHRGAVLSVKWSPRDEYLLASGSADHGIRLWDVRKARTCLLSLDQHNTNTASIPRHGSVSAHNGSVNGLAFTSDGLHLVSTGHDETIRLWDVFAGKNALVNYGPHVRNRVDHVLQPVISPLNATETPLIFHPSDNRQILAFNLWTGKLEMRLRRHAGRVSCVALRDNANSFELYSGGNDHEILCWQSRRAKEDLSD